MSSDVHSDKLHELSKPHLENGDNCPSVLGLSKTVPIKPSWVCSGGRMMRQTSELAV